MTKYQFTFSNPENKYKPITVTLIPRPHEKIASLKKRAVEKVCAERYWTIHDMAYKYNYTCYKYRTIKED
jgi:hypothetical protein